MWRRWEKLTERAMKPRRITTAQLLHSEWNRRLGVCSIIAIGGAMALSLGLYVEVPKLLSLHSTSTSQGTVTTSLPLSSGAPLIALLIASVLLCLATRQMVWLSRRFPQSCLQYSFSYVNHSELMAFFTGWTQLADFISLISIFASTLSAHGDLLFRGAITENMRTDVDWWRRLDPDCQQSTLNIDDQVACQQHYVDWFSLAAVFGAGLLLLCSLRVLITITVVFFIFATFTTASTTVVAFLHNLHDIVQFKLPRIQAIADAHGYDEVLNETYCYLFGFLAIECLSFLAEEMDEQPRRVTPIGMRWSLWFHQIVTATVLLSFFPFVHRMAFTEDTPLPAAFSSIRIYSARYLMNCGSFCALIAALLCAFLPPTRLMNAMGRDRLLPFGQGLGEIHGKGGSPRVAVVITALLSLLVNATIPKAILARLIPLNLCLRLLCLAYAVFKASMPSPESIEDGDQWSRGEKESTCLLSTTTGYKRMHSCRPPVLPNSASNSSCCDHDRDTPSEFSSSASDFDVHEVMRRYEKSALTEEVWRMMVMSSAPATNSNKSIVAATAIPHNCLYSPCSSSMPTSSTTVRPSSIRVPLPPPPSRSSRCNQELHVYDTDEADYGFGRLVVRRVSGGCDGGEEDPTGLAATTGKTGLRLYFSFITASMLIAVTHKILRETREYTPILPLVSIVLAALLCVALSISLYRMRAGTNNSSRSTRARRIGCLLSTLVVVQLMLQFALAQYLALSVLYVLGLLIYASSLWRR